MNMLDDYVNRKHGKVKALPGCWRIRRCILQAVPAQLTQKQKGAKKDDDDD